MKIKITLLICVIILSPGVSLAEIPKESNESRQPREKFYPLESTTTKEPKTSTEKLDIPCIKTSVSVRETAVTAAFKTFTETMTTLLSTRKSSLEDSFSKPTAKERAEARKLARAEFKKGSTAAHKALSVARQDAWIGFKNTSKSCKGGSIELRDETPSAARSTTEAL